MKNLLKWIGRLFSRRKKELDEPMLLTIGYVVERGGDFYFKPKR